MPSFEVAVAWLVLCPLAYLTNLLAIAVVMHYRHLYHSADVAVISLLVTMAISVFLVVPIPAIMEVAGMKWNHDFCSFYSWLTLTLRSSHLIVLLVLNVYWMVSMRNTHEGHMFVTSHPMKIAVLLSWFVAVVVGIMPASGGTALFGHYEDGQCKILPYEISVGFGVLFIIACMASVVMGLISSLDAMCLFKSMKRVAETKYQADRFHVPEVDGGKAPTSARINVRYNELNVAMELCRLGTLVTLASAVINELPFMVLQFLLMFDISPRATLEQVSHWTLLVESLLVPHLLWLSTKRYRHGLVYYWQLMLDRKGDVKEKDVASCPQQASRLRAREYHEKVQVNGVKVPKANGAVSIAESEGIRAGIRRPSANRVTPAGPRVNLGEGHTSSSTDGPITTDLDDGMAVLTELTESQINGISGDADAHRQQQSLPQATTYNKRLINGVVNPEDYIIKNTAARNTASLPRVAFIKSGDVTGTYEDDVHTGRPPPSSSASSPCKSTHGTPQRQARDVKRSASTNSRREWKERMLKKHLPAVFLSSSYDDKKEAEEEIRKQKTSNKDVIELERVNQFQSSMEHSQIDSERLQNKEDDNDSYHNRPTLKRREPSSEDSYYISSEYHYNYLGDSMPRKLSLQTQGTAESDGVSNTYDADDINHILDGSASEANSHSTREGDARSTRSVSATARERAVVILEDTDIITKKNSQNVFVRDTSIRHNEKNAPIGLGSTNKGERDVSEDNMVHEISPVLNSQHKTQDQSLTNSDGDYRKPVPIVRRMKYRDYMRNSALQVSSVDDDQGDSFDISDGDHKEENAYVNSVSVHNTSQAKDDVVLVDLDSQSHGYDSELKVNGTIGTIPEEGDAEHDETQTQQQQRQQEQRKSDSGDSVDILVTDEHEKEIVDTVLVSQDYDQLETVSGNELLHLKLRAMRSATAVSFDDDEDDDSEGGDVSENDGRGGGGGITNRAFERDENINETIGSFLESKNSNSHGRSSNVRYVYGGDNDNADKKNSHSNSSSHDKQEQSFQTQASRDSITVTPSAVRLESVHSEDGDFKVSDKKDLFSKKYETNPFFRESFEVLSQTLEYKRRINSQDNPFKSETSIDLIQSQPSIDSPTVINVSSSFHNEENVINVTSVSPRPPLVVKSSSTSSMSDKLKTKPPIPAKPNVKPLVPLKKPLRLKKAEIARSTSTEQTSESEDAMNAAREARFVRPRTSSEDELEKIFIKREESGFQEDPSIPVEDPSTKSMPTLHSTSSLVTSSPPINGSKTLSTSSDTSIVIEPYGQRRPPWLDDVECFESSQDTVILPEKEELISESDTDVAVHPASPEFVYTVHEMKPFDVVEYNLDAMNFDGDSSAGSSSGYGTTESNANGPRKTTLFNNNNNNSNSNPNANNSFNSNSSCGSSNSNGSSSAITPVSSEERPTIQFYQFDDDIEKGFEDALSMEYVTQSNAYSGFGLCFESIKEEPEDSLSESASSFDGLNESNASSIFKTQAIISRPSSRASVASFSNLEAAPTCKPADDFNQTKPSMNGHLGVPLAVFPTTFETSERTSADGREETASAFNGNGCHHVTSGTTTAHDKTSDSSNNQDFAFGLNDSSEFWDDFHVSHGDLKKTAMSPNNISTVRLEPSDGGFDLNDDVFLPTSHWQSKNHPPVDVNPMTTTTTTTKSPWLELERLTPDMDMSFDSDFSHQSGDWDLDKDSEVGVRKVIGDSSPTISGHGDGGISPEIQLEKNSNGMILDKSTDNSTVEPVYF